MLNDVHVADEASLEVFAFIGRELSNSSLLVIATYRDIEVRRGHPLARTLGELMREQLTERITLTGLGAPRIGCGQSAKMAGSRSISPSSGWKRTPADLLAPGACLCDAYIMWGP